MFDLFKHIEIGVQSIVLTIFIVLLGLTASVACAQVRSNSVVGHTGGKDLQEETVNQPRQVEIEVEFQKGQARFRSARSFAELE